MKNAITLVVIISGGHSLVIPLLRCSITKIEFVQKIVMDTKEERQLKQRPNDFRIVDFWAFPQSCDGNKHDILTY